MSYPSDLEYPRRVVVDDTDPRVNYEKGTWTLDVGSFDSLGIFGSPYNHTMHGTNSKNASFSFQFSGEFVQVRGAKENRRINRPQNVTSDNTTVLAKWTCQVDGSSIRTTPYREFMYDITNNMLCEQGRLSRSLHTFTLNVTIDDPNSQIWWLDKIEYAPLPDADLSKEVLKIDASDPSIQYDNATGNWRDISGLFNGTGTTGASMTFNFNGTSVSLYGFNEGSGQAWQSGGGRYFVDDSGDTTFEVPGSKPLPFTSDNRADWYNQLLFTTPSLSPGSHEMVIAYTGVGKGSMPVQWLSIDYFYVTASQGGAQLNSSSNVPDGLPSRQDSRGKTPVGAIVGGVFGGVATLALIALAIFFFIRRKERRDMYEGAHYDVVPFNPENMHAAPTGVAGGILAAQHHPSVYSTTSGAIPSQYSHSSSAPGTIPTTSINVTSTYDPYRDSTNQASPQHGSSSAFNSTNSNSSHLLPLLVPNRLSVVNPTPEDSTTLSSLPRSVQSSSNALRQNWSDMKSAQRDAVSPPVVERQHQDSGIRYSQNSQRVVDVPPSYTED